MVMTVVAAQRTERLLPQLGIGNLDLNQEPLQEAIFYSLPDDNDGGNKYVAAHVNYCAGGIDVSPIQKLCQVVS